jgi:hypothetical protein
MPKKIYTKKTNRKTTRRNKVKTAKSPIQKRYKGHNGYKGQNGHKRTKRNAYAKGPDSSAMVNCCMCGKEISRENGLVPSKCLMKNGAIRGHRICQECWWSKFAKEGVNHNCPGCEKGLPLNGPPLDKNLIVDLTMDD